MIAIVVESSIEAMSIALDGEWFVDSNELLEAIVELLDDELDWDELIATNVVVVVTASRSAVVVPDSDWRSHVVVVDAGLIVFVVVVVAVIIISLATVAGTVVLVSGGSVNMRPLHTPTLEQEQLIGTAMQFCVKRQSNHCH